MDAAEFMHLMLSSVEKAGSTTLTTLVRQNWHESPGIPHVEDLLARYTGARHCIAVGSNMDAIRIALMAIGVKPGDEVITTPFSGLHTAEAVVRLGAIPVFADVARSSCNMNTAAIEQLVTARTRAIVPVSMFGQPADMETINAIAESNGVAVIEDAAYSFGATYLGKKSCNLSTIGCTSFNTTVSLGESGNGGAIFTSDDDIAAIVRHIRHNEYPLLGFGRRNGFMGVLQCAVVLAGLENYDNELQQRAEICADYDALLAGQLTTMTAAPDRTSACTQYVVALADREQILKTICANARTIGTYYGVPTSTLLQPEFARSNAAKSCPVALEMGRKLLSLSVDLQFHPEFAHHIAATLLRAIGLQASYPLRP